MLSLLLVAAQSSLLVAPLHHGERPPQARAVAALRIDDEPGRPGSALVAARELLVQLRDPEQFIEAARAAATRRSVRRAGVVGIHPPGLLAPVIDDALAELSVGRRSAPLETDGGVWIVQRIEDVAACRQIFIAGAAEDGLARAQRLATLARGGDDFARLAREHSDDRASALRGGALALFERGAHDSTLRAAAFAAQVGEIVGPIATPLGYHVLQRVGVEDVDPRLRDDSWARVRAILLAFSGAAGASPTVEREHDAAQRLAEELAARIRRGEDMAELARAHSDDLGLRELGGDCGWVRRGVTRMPDLFDRVFVEPPGRLIGPIASPAGYLMLRREDRGLRSRIDVRVEAFADLEQWVRALAEHEGAPSPPEGLEAAVAAARALDAADRGGALWAQVEDLVPQCTSARDFAILAGRLPESHPLAEGRVAPLRKLALAWATALVAAEHLHTTLVWPGRRRLLEERMAPLRAQFSQLAPLALEQLLAALGIEDPRVVLPIFLVAQTPRAALESRRAGSNPASLLVVEAREGLALVEQVMNAAGRALDAAAGDGASALSQLRAALASAGFATNPAAREVEQAVWSVASAWSVRRVFDGSHRDLGAADGAYEVLGAAAEVVLASWTDCFEGHSSVEAAIQRTLEALAAKGK